MECQLHYLTFIFWCLGYYQCRLETLERRYIVYVFSRRIWNRIGFVLSKPNSYTVKINLMGKLFNQFKYDSGSSRWINQLLIFLLKNIKHHIVWIDQLVELWIENLVRSLCGLVLTTIVAPPILKDFLNNLKPGYFG